MPDPTKADRLEAILLKLMEALVANPAEIAARDYVSLRSMAGPLAGFYDRVLHALADADAAIHAKGDCDACGQANPTREAAYALVAAEAAAIKAEYTPGPRGTLWKSPLLPDAVEALRALGAKGDAK